MKVVSVGDRVEAGAYRLHSRFKTVTNYRLEAGRPRPAVLCLVTPAVGSGPINVVVEGEFPEADSVVLESDVLMLDGRRSPLGPRYDSALPEGPPAPAMVEALTRHLRAAAHPKSLAFLLDESRAANFRPGFEQNMAKQIRDGARLLLGADPAQGARLLRGCGFGLTPAGDDLLAGALIASHLAGPTRHPERGKGFPSPAPGSLWRSLAALGMTGSSGTLLSDAFLALAAEGRVNEPVKQLLAALVGADTEAMPSCADRVLAHGETSGADILTGLVLAVHKGFNFQQPTFNSQRPTGETHDGER
ncbi:MAG: DUF2877 domain-containing protein [Kiritimatiellae bacterium]|nr:DUF2877 domain-containing protein [Kiritimatiellia bacterium]